MAPSTVFSYLRRDHRRPSSPAPSSPVTATHPAISPVNPHSAASYSPRLTGGISTYHNDQSVSGSGEPQTTTATSTTRLQPGSDQERTKGRSASYTPLQLPTFITDPAPTSYLPVDGRPRSVQDAAYLQQQHVPVAARLDPYESGTHIKPTSPWKLSFGKGILSSDNSKSGNGPGSSTSLGSGSGKGKSGGSPDNAGVETGGGGGGGGGGGSGSGGGYSRVEGGNTEPAAPTPSSSRSGKTRLNLLNPMALLARRRSGQSINPRPEDIGIGRLALPALPDDFDPRIRGNVLHDFSAPRPRPNLANNRVNNSHQSRQANMNNVNGGQEPPHYQEANQRQHIEHTPLFKEHFEDDRYALQVEQKGCLESMATSQPPPPCGPPPSVPFAKNLPKRLPSLNDNNSSDIEQEQPPEIPSTSSSTRHPPFTSSNSRSKSQSSQHENGPPRSGLPRHLTSSASRFSFDMAGVESSSQEKLMEEKHKAKEEARRAKAQLDRANANDSDSDNFDYEDMMGDDDGLEERIPGVNADDDDSNELSQFLHHGQGPNASGNLFVPVLPTILSSPMSPLELNSPAVQTQSQQLPTQNDFTPSQIQNAPSGERHKHDPWRFSAPLEDDNFYFDDGMIDDLTAPQSIEGGEKFDESIFDDPTSHLYERRTRMSVQLPPVEEAPTTSTTEPENDDVGNLRHENSVIGVHGHGHITGGLGDINASLGSVHIDEGLKDNDQPQPSVSGLTEGNLEAYHSALAKAANEAAMKGRFRRGSESEGSVDQKSVPPSPDSHPGLTAGASQVSHPVDTMGFEESFDDFDYDDAYLDDDPMIAAANAEVLENDDEGFYGQEFGFYAQAISNCESEMALGGYFGPRAIEGITRSHSGRANFTEPSLTPITERSEWSTRNSVVSLATHGTHPNTASVTSPPLTQLLDMGNLDDEMTLSALMKLRRGAWGGSNGSLRSSAASQGTSPQAHQSPSNLGSFTNFHDVGGILSSPSSAGADNNYVRQSDSESWVSAGVMQRNSMHMLPYGTSQEQQHDDEQQQQRRPPSLSIDTAKANVAGKPDRGHSRTNSATESVSYVKETDEWGGDRWVVEKRRFSEDGGMEIVDREFMMGGRI
ncbi:hypothetical protein AJ80_07028 [Polytolypa hystricis UAMH7299]|uniref:AGC-kinase C-terminal domain-containing protein n=1 Tax=Polytolypa hystricis (strain UAMH7299) TaxID=1447883 RepID=A0A2B7XSB5_POLH7|nr:hypothetical protein AJ80_07028 [Polytolypa hystricis UAMH7299]